ncbi:carbon-nitrogen hydrolase family protein [Geosporobacter ferrireducens]|uniref:carbon-nitrogen hydrolase family protein n=1 Tax=Geosporobacter ferrireducens TaxID=1424294 RepID=UPI00139DBCEC|nr:carbon-nitrogen hydrolase family protein [Geosporobacter ferrireducens]MTI54614.1 carbon-nitrogen hydrolase family protein [Geosporobacter ferrireducens]
MSVFKIAVCQMLIEEEKDRNLKRAETMIRESAAAGSQWVVLPEMFNCPYDNKYFPDFAEEFPGPTTKMLSSLAKELSIFLIGGSIPERYEDKIYNTSFIFDFQGNLAGKHRKMHLFDIDVAGGIRFQESEILSAGEGVTVANAPQCPVGVSICYDMRFPELVRLMTLEGAKVIVIPAAFNMTTGPAHWELLARTRALDNQVYFIAASPARNLNTSYHAYGHSIVVNPWGTVIAQADEKEGILYVEIDLELVEKVRRELPLLAHRRKDVYALCKK